MDYPFTQWAPDQGDLADDATAQFVGGLHLMQADGAQPLADGFGPYPDLVVGSTATAMSGGAPRGLFGYTSADGTWNIAGFTGTTVELKGPDDTWTSIDTGLTCTDGDDWSVERYGSKLLYTNTTDGLRAYDVEAGGAATAIADAGDPRWICECGGILFNFDCTGDDGERNNRLIRSSALGDHTNYDTKGADYQEVQTGDALLWGGRLTDTTMLVLQRRAVKLIQVGNVGNALWGIQTIAEESGTVGAKCCVRFNGAVYWFATDGFKRFTLGKGIESIGAGRVDQWFLDRVDQSDLSLIQGCIDPFRKNVMWRWKRSANASTTVFEDVLCYNWIFDKWFTLTLDTSYLGFSAQTAQTWDALDATETWDAFRDVTWDSRFLQGGQPIFGAMDADYKFGYFTGENMAATIETALRPLGPKSGMISRATPQDNSDDGTLELGVRLALNDGTTWKTGVAKQASGTVPLRGRAKYAAMRRNITAGSSWTFAKGVDLGGGR